MKSPLNPIFLWFSYGFPMVFPSFYRKHNPCFQRHSLGFRSRGLCTTRSRLARGAKCWDVFTNNHGKSVDITWKFDKLWENYGDIAWYGNHILNNAGICYWPNMKTQWNIDLSKKNHHVGLDSGQVKTVSSFLLLQTIFRHTSSKS